MDEAKAPDPYSQLVMCNQEQVDFCKLFFNDKLAILC